MSNAADLSAGGVVSRRWPVTATRVMSGLAFALGLTGMAGWYAHVPALIQWHPAFAPMQYNSALCFLLAGAALFAMSANRRWLVFPLACAVTLISLLTLAQYLFAMSFGIDQLLFRSYIFTQTSHPGRMSPVTALTFSMSGSALMVGGINRRREGGAWVMGLLSAVVLALGATALLGYVTGLTGAYGWGRLTPMALNTAFGFFALGLGLFAGAWENEFTATRRSPRWLPVFTGLTTLSATLILCHALNLREQAGIEQTIRANADTVKNEIVARLDSRIRSLARMARRWEFAGKPPREIWEDDATAYFEDAPGYQGIAWVDPAFRIQWVVPLAVNHDSVGRDLAGEERRRLALVMAREERRARFTRPVQLRRGGTGILAYVPIYHRGRFEGLIVGGIRLKELLDSTLGANLAADYAITLTEGGETIYTRPGGPKPSRKDWLVEIPIAIHGVDWTAQIWPGVALLAAHRSPYSQALLILGVVVSVLLGHSVSLAQGAIARSQQLAVTNAELQREIVERQCAEQEVQKLAELHRAIVSHAAYSVISTTPDGIITSFNPAAERMLGYTAEEVVGRVTPVLIHEPGEVAERARTFTEEMGETIEPGFDVFVAKARRNLPNHCEWTYVRKDGSRFPVMVGVTPLRDQTGEVIGFLKIAEDISELKRTEADLRLSHQQLLEASRQAGRAEVASSVLHNVGNVLTSINVSATVVTGAIRKSKAAKLLKVVALLHEHSSDLPAFLTRDPRGRLLPGYLEQLTEQLADERDLALKELAGLQRDLEHINDIVAMEQNYDKVPPVTETLDIAQLVENALSVNASALMRNEIQVIREYAMVPQVTVEKHKVVQILVNLIRNATGACYDSERTDKRLTVRVANGDRRVKVFVIDNGIGIAPEHLTRIFNHGFTTRKEGHGFGLHSGALAAKEMGGSLAVHSDGPGKGAAFLLELPCPTGESSHE